jgi:hypothetical protein
MSPLSFSTSAAPRFCPKCDAVLAMLNAEPCRTNKSLAVGQLFAAGRQDAAMATDHTNGS